MANKLTIRDYFKIAVTLLLLVCGLMIVSRGFAHPSAFIMGGLFVALGIFRSYYIIRYLRAMKKEDS